MGNVTSIGEVSPKLCYICLGDLETYTPDQSVPIRKCIRCGEHFCLAHVSKIDPSACERCVKDVVVSDTVFEKTETDWDAKKDRLVTHTQKCRQVTLSGEDWVWLTRRIATLSDDELKSVIQYHKATVSAIEAELTERTIKRFQTNAVVPGQPQISVRTVTTKTTTRVAKPKQPDISKLASAIKTLGLSPEKLQELLKNLA